MPRGYTTITFKGGNRDGDIKEDVPLQNLKNTMSFQNEIYFATANDGGMNIMKGRLNSQWHSYTVDIYSKVANNKRKQGTIFEFIETRNVERCSTITRKKTQCLKPAIHGKNYCGERHKQKEK